MNEKLGSTAAAMLLAATCLAADAPAAKPAAKPRAQKH
jgi:hypothetical protein